MELNDYQKEAMSTCMETSSNYTYMADGLVGEVGEFMSKVTKAIRKGEAYVNQNALYGTDELNSGLMGELGDIMWFVAGIAMVFGWSLEEVAESNLGKLASRKRRGVIVGDGDNR